MSAKKKAAPQAMSLTSRAKVAYTPEIPLTRIEAMELALIGHIYSGDIVEGKPLSTKDAKEIYEAILLLKRILSRGKISPPVSRVEKPNLLATALARDIIRVFKCSRDNAVLAAFPNPKGRDVETLTRTYNNLLPKLAKTKWSVSVPANLILTSGYAAGLSKKPMSKELGDAWTANARERFAEELKKKAKPQIAFLAEAATRLRQLPHVHHNARRQMQTEEGRKLYSPNSAAKALDVSRSKIYDLMKAGALRYVTIDSDRRIPASEIDRLSREGAGKKPSAE